MTELLTTMQLCTELGVKRTTVTRWAAAGIGPPRVVVGQFIRYRRQDVDAWLLANRSTP